MKETALNTQYVKQDHDNALVGITIEFDKNKVSDSKGIVDLLQEVFYDTYGAAGHFRLFPKRMKSLASDKLVTSGESMTEQDFDDAITVSNEGDSVTASLLFTHRSDDSAVSLEEELKIFGQDLNEFVANGYSQSWAQYDLN